MHHQNEIGAIPQEKSQMYPSVGMQKDVDAEGMLD